MSSTKFDEIPIQLLCRIRKKLTHNLTIRLFCDELLFVRILGRRKLLRHLAPLEEGPEEPGHVACASLSSKEAFEVME